MMAIDELLSLWEIRKEQGSPISPEELCRDCPELLGEVRWHIRALQAVESQFGATRIEQPPSTVRVESSGATAGSGPVRITSEYRIERLHASGGLGDVFLATDPVLNRKVAIKFPKWSRLTSEQRARFEREARVTGRLDHPGIVPVHSLKQDDPDRPCYVMRFIEGPTLHETIQKLHNVASGSKSGDFFYSLDFRHLLQNLIALGNIVAFANGKGVVHRDIKPGNVILGPFGETILVDWGLARVFDDKDELSADLAPSPQPSGQMDTRDGQVMGTPAFASPEQLLGQTSRTDHRADIYSLGATLYFMLTGTLPVESGPVQLQIEKVACGNILSPRSRCHSIPLALDAICRRAMATDPEQRYQSASAFTVDLERFLAGESVSVVADSFWTKCGRYLRRRPGLVAATLAAVFMAILAGIAGSAILNQKNRQLVHSNDRLEVAISESRQASQRALAALRSLVDDVVIRDLSEIRMLDSAERNYLNSILGQYSALASVQGDGLESRAIRAEGLMQMGKIQLRLSDEQEALENLEAAVAQFQKLVDESGQFGPRLQLAETFSELGEVLLRLGRLEQANERVRTGIDLFSSTSFSPEEQQKAEPVLAGLYRVLGNVQQGQRQWKQSSQSFEEARQRLESIIRSEPSPNAANQQMLAAVYRHMGETSAQLGDLARQVEYSELALELQRQLVKQFPDQPDYELGLAQACINCSRHRETAGHISAAIGELSEAIVVAERLADRFPQLARYRETLSGLHSRRGNLEWKQERPEQAESDLVQAIALFQKLIGDFPEVPQYPDALMRTQLSLAEIKLQRNRAPAAESIFRKLFSVGKEFSERFPDIAASSMTLSMAEVENTGVLLRQGRVADTIRPLEEAISRFAKIGESDDSATPKWWQARSLILLGRSQHALGLGEPALVSMEKSARLLSELESRYSGDLDLLSRLATTHRELAAGFSSLNLDEKARFYRQRELELRVAVVDRSPANPYYRVLHARALMDQGDDFRRSRDLSSAQDLHTQAGETIANALASFRDDRLVRMTAGDLRATEGRVLNQKRDFANAEIKFAEAVELNPSLRNRASRANNMSRLHPEKVLEMIDMILAERIPDTLTLKSLFVACGTAANGLADPAMGTALGDRMVTMLQHMVDDDYLPHPQTIRELKSSATYAVFQARPDYMRLVDILHERDRAQTATSFDRSLPEPLQPAWRWLSRRTIDDLNLEKWAAMGLEFLRIPGWR
jgi:eukaryotic-like serine/threonine-protein kinase